MSGASSWWTPDSHADRRPLLLSRNRMAAYIRRWFTVSGFVEVETGIAQPSPGNETHLHAFTTELCSPADSRTQLYLRTSPEFACKKLLAAGENRIFEFARVFRNRERGPLHAPEFTLLEWYRSNESYETLMEDCANLMRLGAQAAGVRRFSYRDASMDPFAELERVTVAGAFQRYAGIDLMATLSPEPQRDVLSEAAQAAGIRTAKDDTWADVFSRVLVERIEPQLGLGSATVLYEYPAVLSALAQPAQHDARVAERFELYACGVELANAFGELTDAELQRERLLREMAEKERLYGERYPLDEDFLAALAAMPPASGAALGFDRLVMLATGASRIEQVMWTPMAGH